MNQDKRFTLEEFLEAAKAAKEDEAAAVQRSGPELNNVLRRVSAYIKDDAVGFGDNALGIIRAVEARTTLLEGRGPTPL